MEEVNLFRRYVRIIWIRNNNTIVMLALCYDNYNKIIHLSALSYLEIFHRTVKFCAILKYWKIFNKNNKGMEDEVNLSRRYVRVIWIKNTIVILALCYDNYNKIIHLSALSYL